MDVSDIVSTDFPSFDAETPASKLASALEDSATSTLLVTDDGEFEGVVTRRRLASSHHVPEEKARSLVWHVPTVTPRSDVREVARLMVGSGVDALPVREDGDDVTGVVTADALLGKVQPFLSVLAVEDVASSELVTVGPGTTVGEALHYLREHRITHLPVVDADGDPVGVLSLRDLLGFTTREIHRAQGGESIGFDEHGGSGSHGGYRSHGGFGARGDRQRLLDVPVRTVMAEPVATCRPTDRLDEAVDRMFGQETSSLVVVDEDGSPTGIVTKTDVLEALTWGEESRRPVQLFGADYLDDMTYEEVSDLVDQIASRYGDMNVIEAKVHLHPHDEKLRGTPLLLARIRLYTDKGLFVASDEGYGASHALHMAANALEREVLKGKTYGRSKKHPGEEYWERLFGWWVTG